MRTEYIKSEFFSAARAGVLDFKPRFDALVMELMFARKLNTFSASFLANGALFCQLLNFLQIIEFFLAHILGYRLGLH